MSLVNLFFWMTLLLTALLGWQIVASYESAETEARRQYARIRQTGGHPHSAYPASNIPTVRPASGNQFLTVGRAGETPNGAAGIVECFQPVNRDIASDAAQKNMTTEDGCHICA